MIVREDAAVAGIVRTKTEKGREFGKISSRVKNFGEFRREKILLTYSGHNCVRSVPKSLPFSFLHNFFDFSRIVRRRLRQAVCKTVAETPGRFKSFTMQSNRERNSNG